ncbi:hypothetical protein DIPPA_54895 [Diplonema papillatum]|nr:hypothetical protein DIPPA_54895 [Diplonema papillatum]
MPFLRPLADDLISPNCLPVYLFCAFQIFVRISLLLTSRFRTTGAPHAPEVVSLYIWNAFPGVISTSNQRLGTACLLVSNNFAFCRPCMRPDRPAGIVRRVSQLLGGADVGPEHTSFVCSPSSAPPTKILLEAHKSVGPPGLGSIGAVGGLTSEYFSFVCLASSGSWNNAHRGS